MDAQETTLELPCPQCRYNVVTQVMQQMRRCPECGGDLPLIRIEPQASLRARWMATVGLVEPSRAERFFIVLGVVNLVLGPVAYASIVLLVRLCGWPQVRSILAFPAAVACLSIPIAVAVALAALFARINNRLWILALLNGGWVFFLVATGYGG